MSGVDIAVLAINFLMIAIEIYSWIFLIYILLSWFPIDRDNVLVKFIVGLCEPLYKGILKILPPIRIGRIDLSILYVIGLFYLARFLLSLLAKAIVGG